MEVHAALQIFYSRSPSDVGEGVVVPPIRDEYHVPTIHLFDIRKHREQEVSCMENLYTTQRLLMPDFTQSQCHPHQAIFVRLESPSPETTVWPSWSRIKTSWEFSPGHEIPANPHRFVSCHESYGHHATRKHWRLPFTTI